MLLETQFADLGAPKKGKVRDIYDLGDKLLIVVSDRVSAFDVVLPTGIPDKGKVLNQLSLFWFRQMEDVVKNHVLESEVDRFPDPLKKYSDALRGRSMVVKKAKPFPVECVVRGYLSGSGWSEYKDKGSVCGIELPKNLQESQRLDEPIFTPTTKADEGHDLAISMEQTKDLIGAEAAAQLKQLSISIYKRAAAFAEKRGIIIADTKFEFGVLDGETIIIDEILTPDSSRFWSAKDYTVGRGQDSFDKQIVRDYLNTLDWDKTYPGPELPPAIVEKTAQRYREIFEILSGSRLR
ncbi:MAG: Phosphoribosylaminoimidazole-succinocarboxamide synthase [Syntrophorhabdaceae bacterium PtaU1.Bin034]|jgi:phosphoribosylaminoimidazole-succinocarboxamide synthase|nr:MAG: Phosphoribosylaminoimidazole-succinocarboxamide synthase [Syntrophorhabdaceae bacterium PtaU1.Bin034]